jgi:hypothetical protein
MFEDEYQGELSEEQVYFRQLLMITGLSSRLYMDTSTEWQVNVRNYVSSINNFEATAIRHLDSEYKNKLDLIRKHAQQKLLKYRRENPQRSATNIGKEFEIELTIDYARKKLSLIMRTLDNKGVFNQKTYNAIQDPTKEEIDQAMGIPESEDPTGTGQA